METISESSLRFNMQQITYCRTTTAVLTGSTAGILGLTGLLGFVLYFVTAVLVSVGLLAKAGSKSSSYFPSNYRFVLSNHSTDKYKYFINCPYDFFVSEYFVRLTIRNSLIVKFTSISASLVQFAGKNTRF